MGAQIILGTPLFSADAFQWAGFRNGVPMKVVGTILLQLFLTGNTCRFMVVFAGLKMMPLFWMTCILIDVGLLLTLVCVSLLIHNVHVA